MNRLVDGMAKNFIAQTQGKRLAHLPLLTLVYLQGQRSTVATPVTALELAAYLGVEVGVAEQVLEFLASHGVVRLFKEDMAAYCLNRELHEISVFELLPLLLKFQELIPATGAAAEASAEADEKYRRLYSELASEMLQLFGQQSVNQLPI
ncbi:Rrf2 family transcriptional regulator [bacterium]|nr:MAG: Rrf2 family transcriptional regulator [bacterium]